jgi:hypothetical protein
LEPLTEAQLTELFKKMRLYKFLFIIYVASAVLYGAAAVALVSRVPRSSLPLADGALIFGLLVVAAVFLGRWLAFRSSALRARGLESLEAMTRYIFVTLAFLLAAGETLGMVAVTAASMGGGPAWKLCLLCLWQLLVALVLTPERAHWDRLLGNWEATFS